MPGGSAEGVSAGSMREVRVERAHTRGDLALASLWDFSPVVVGSHGQASGRGMASLPCHLCHV